MSELPAEHVRAAFGVLDHAPERLPDGQGLAYRCGDVVLKPAADAHEAAWIAGTVELLKIDGIRLARPVRSKDGRWVVGGWSAQRFLPGKPTNNYDDVLKVADTFHRGVAQLGEPKFLRDRNDLYSQVDRVAWGEADDPRLAGAGHGAGLFAELAAGRRPVSAPAQVVHGDLFGNVLFSESAPPAVIDITPYWRPESWAAAVIVVDAMAWGGASTELVERNANRADWSEMLRRAVLFRLGVSLAHPRSTAESLVEILSTAEILRPYLDR